MYKYPNLGETIYFHFGVNDTNGSGSSGTTPTARVRLAGDSISAAPIYTATPYLLSNVNYPAGCYEVAIPATSGNGFINGNEYSVFSSLTVSSQNPTGNIGAFKLVPINANTIQILGQNPVNEITSGVIAANISASVSLNTISSGVMQALNTVISASSPSGSINYKMYNLATDTDLIGELLNTIVTSYSTANTVGRIFRDLASGNIASIIPAGSTGAPTVTQIRQEIDSNSTQLAALTTRLSALRAGYLDNLSSGIVAQNTDVKTLLNRLTNLRSTYLDNLSAGAIALNSDMSTLLTRVSANRAGYFDNLSSGLVASKADMQTLLSRINANRALYLDNLSGGSIALQSYSEALSGLINTTNTRLTNTRAGYLDNLSAGAVALNADIITLLNRLTSGRAGYLDNLGSGAIALNSDMQTLLNRINANRAGYLDNLSSGSVATHSFLSQVNQKIDTVTTVTNAIKAISDQINFTGTKVNAYNTNDSSGVITLLNRIIGTIATGTHYPQSGDGFTVSQNILAVANKLDTMMELDGAVYQFTTNALLNSPTSTGGFTTDDRLLITGINSTTSILNTMIENVSGYRYTTKSLETVGNNLTLANTKLDISSGVLSNIYNQTTNTGVHIADVETGLSFIHAMQAIFALTAKMNGGGTTTINARNYADNKNRLTWTTDASNNRLTVTFNFD